MFLIRKIVCVLKGDAIRLAKTDERRPLIRRSATDDCTDLDSRAEQGACFLGVQLVRLRKRRWWRLAQIAGLASYHSRQPTRVGEDTRGF